jgi:hypothetical protein
MPRLVSNYQAAVDYRGRVDEVREAAPALQEAQRILPDNPANFSIGP